MRIFVGNLPLNFSQYDLRKLACKELMPSNTMEFLGEIFKKTHKIKRAAFEVINESNGYYQNPFGVIFIEPDSMGLKLIQRLDKMYYRENVLVAREFVVRAYSNDRRDVNWRQKMWAVEDRRLCDRRLSITIPTKEEIVEL